MLSENTQSLGQNVKWRTCVEESHHLRTLRTHCTIGIRAGGNPGVVVHLHTPVYTSARHFSIEGSRLSIIKIKNKSNYLVLRVYALDATHL